MRWSTHALPVVLLSVCTTPFVLAGSDKEQVTADEKLLQSARLDSGGPGLVNFFRKRSAAITDKERVASLIQQLGDTKASLADQAVGELVATGPAVVPLLHEALKTNPTTDAAPRIKQCLQWLEGPSRIAIPAAAARLLAIRKPAGATEALLAYYPSAEADGVANEISDVLADVGLRDGKAEPALLAALTDKTPQRRGVAAEILGQINSGEHRPAIRPLLKDPEAMVRLQAALALTNLRDQEAIPVLIALLEELPPLQGRRAEEALLQLAGSLAPSAPLGSDEGSRKKCAQAWIAWWKTSEGTVVLDYFRTRTLPDAQQDKATTLIRLLGHSSFKVREKATADLLALRSLALPLLKQALKDPSVEVRIRSQHCLDHLARAPEAARSTVNVRLLCLRYPEQAAEVLLAFLPFADGESVEEEIRGALIALARMDKRTHAALLARLDDKFAQRRAVAAEALAQTGSAEHLKAIKNRLKDPEPFVRLRVALALAGQKEREAIPVLIALLTELPLEQGRLAEDLLQRLAEAQSPSVALGSDAGSRQKCRDAWTAWWQQNQDRADLAQLQSRARLLGYTVMARWSFNGNTNELIELGANGQLRWKIDGLGYTFDFQLLSNGRILMVENNLGRVTERNSKGDILWEYKVSGPLNCQRLSNGNTFIAADGELVEVDRLGNVIYRIQKHNMSGRKLSDGRIAYLQSNGTCTWVDTTGKILKTAKVGGTVSNMGGMDALPHGGVLLTLRTENKVVELDANGNIHWHAKLESPNMATRLPNGRTLVGSQDGRYAVEVDTTGRVVWEHRPGLAVWRARKR